MEFYFKHLNTARSFENENQKEVFEAATNTNEGKITIEKIIINDWVIKDEDDDRNFPRNVMWNMLIKL